MHERIITLETYIAEQDKTITELSDVMAEQWKTIETLSKRLDRMQRMLESLEVSDSTEVKSHGVMI
ncbi:MAG: SlyX family protein [Halopseudomonas aestusnigri]